jgi:tetratricopeptide (TPR) repeat protein
MFHLQENNYLFFPFGSTFRICSIDQSLDGVWYVKLIYTIDKDLQIVKEQLEYEVNQPLNWLTFGHFLRVLKLIDEAKEYYSFWLRTLSIDHPDLISIHHHLGIFYAEINEDSKALDHMNKVLQFTRPIISEVPHHDQHFGKDEECITSTVNQTTIFANIADIYNKIGKHQMALEFYEKALVTTTDQRYRRQFQYKHRILTNKLNP